MKLSKAKIQILIALSASQYSLSSRDILEAITTDGKASATLPSVYDHLESLKSSGLIENGLSEIVDRKTVLMWKITNNGRVLVGNSKDEIVEAEVIDEPTALLNGIENLDEKIGVLHKLLPIVTDEMAKILEDIIVDLDGNHG